MRLIDVDGLGVGRCSKDVLPAAYCAGWNGLLGLIEKAPTVDAAPVVHCKDCEYSDDEISYLCCTHGVCADCEVPSNFYCADGKRKDGDSNG